MHGIVHNLCAIHVFLNTGHLPHSPLHLHVHTCAPLFHISGTARRNVLKLGVIRDRLAMRLIQATV